LNTISTSFIYFELSLLVFCSMVADSGTNYFEASLFSLQSFHFLNFIFGVSHISVFFNYASISGWVSEYMIAHPGSTIYTTTYSATYFNIYSSVIPLSIPL
tara:strand:- start:395 stop:697 length:303 start_codon:yes stop_codon:yes gene_type:complete